jgi:hypothetical protein
VSGVASRARIALLILEHELDGKDLLQLDTIKHFLLNRQLDFQTPGMWLSPNKARVDQLDAREARNLLQA